MDTPFELLGVEPDADDDAVERAYRERIKDAHPDHGGSPREFQRVRAAYQAVLADEAPLPDEADDDTTDTWEWDPTQDPDADPGVDVEYLNYDVLDDHGWSLSDDDLFERAAAADLDPVDHGRVAVDPEDHLLESAEADGQTWPYACRGGACANCAVAVVEGDLTMTVDHVLPDEMLDRGIRLSCVGVPTTDELKVVYNVKELPDLDDLRLPPYPFERSAAASDD
ncbi:MAG: ferredoxin Fer [Haloferacaceae archaeon]